MRDIETADDLRQVVASFYAIVRQDDFIGPIFNSFIPAEHWPAHIEKITGFWRFRLFEEETYEGRPLVNHLEVDKHTGYGLTRQHFDHWVRLWSENLDRQFSGPVVMQAKSIAENMAFHMGGRVMEMRPKMAQLKPKSLGAKGQEGRDLQLSSQRPEEEGAE